MFFTFALKLAVVMIDAWLMGKNELALFNWYKAFYKFAISWKSI